MDILQIIDKKEKGEVLSKEELQYIIDNFLEGKIKDYQMSAFLTEIDLLGLTEEETINLTNIMLNSGEKININISPIVDKHSTGGVGDKTTIILAPLVASLGVNVIYLNPIFDAHSNHRYNTADYSKIDSLLGDEKDFKALCKKAEEYGIKIILDGVFSHTGSDSIYFNREGRYNSVGAFNSNESPYKDWFTFEENGKYKSWWGIDTLPETNEDNESFIEYISGKNGIAEKWLKCGAYGYRLDVADELPDKFLDEFCKSVKSLNKDYVVIGEEKYGINTELIQLSVGMQGLFYVDEDGIITAHKECNEIVTITAKMGDKPTDILEIDRIEKAN